MKKLLRWLRAPHEAKLRVEIRQNVVVPRPEECDELRELLWRELVQRDADRRRALKLIGES